MKESISCIAEYLGTNANTIVTIFTTIIIFSAGLIASIISRYLSTLSKRRKSKEYFRYLLTEISNAIKNQSIEFKKFADSLTLSKDIDFTLYQRPNPHLFTWERVSFNSNYDAFFGNKLICRIKKKRKAFNKVYEHITNIQNIEKINQVQFNTVVSDYNKYQESWNIASTQIISVFNEILYLPDEVLNKKEFVESFSLIILEWEKYKDARNMEAIIKNIIPKLIEMCDNYEYFKQSLVIKMSINEMKHAYDNLNELITKYKELFQYYYFNYRFAYRVLNFCEKTL